MGLDRLSGPFGVGASSLRYCKYSKVIFNVPKSLPAYKERWSSSISNLLLRYGTFMSRSVVLSHVHFKISLFNIVFPICDSSLLTVGEISLLYSKLCFNQMLPLTIGARQCAIVPLN